MEKKFIIIFGIISGLVIILFFYFWILELKQTPRPYPTYTFPKIKSEQNLGFYRDSSTDIAPELAKQYAITYQDESFEITSLKFSDSNMAREFLEGDILLIADNQSKDTPIDKSTTTINGFAGYIYQRTEEPKGSAIIIQKDNFLLLANTNSINDENIQTVVKWVGKNYLK